MDKTVMVGLMDGAKVSRVSKMPMQSVPETATREVHMMVMWYALTMMTSLSTITRP